jgi:hypothetical protein
MTSKLGYQKIVYSKEIALEQFIESDFLDCRINVFPSLKEGVTWPPNFLFVDLDLKTFESEKSLQKVLDKTLKNIKENLDSNACPTVLFTGGGYHIYQPVYIPTALENITEFQKFDNVSVEFLRFAKNYLSNGKADKNNNPSFKSCLLRIPGSINSKYGNKVSIVKRWNGIRSPIPREFMEEFRIYLIQKKIDEQIQRQKMMMMLLKSKRQNSITTSTNYYYGWIEKILQTPFPDCRKIIVDLVLAPYLINIKKLSYDESYQIIRDGSINAIT